MKNSPELTYAISKDFTAVNPENDLKLMFVSEGVDILTKHDGKVFQSRLSLAGVGFGEDIQPLPMATRESKENTILYHRGDNLTEWYLNTAAGMEQGFILNNCPGDGHCNANLSLDIAVSGDLIPVLSDDSQSLSFASCEGEHVFSYGHLLAKDSNGKVLPTRFAINADSPRTIKVLVDDTHARYPIVIDPLISQQQKLTASDGANNDWFGHSVAIDGETVVIGAPNHGSTGAFYVFTRSGSTWTQQQILTSNDIASGDGFGNNVAIYGNTILCGASSKNTSTGAAYIFMRQGASWYQQAKLLASDGATNDSFGSSVALHVDTAVIGAPQSSTAHGKAYVFVRKGKVWSQQAILTASDGANNDQFYTASIHGDTAVIGAYNKNSATGAAYVFTRSGTTWSQQQKLTASDGAANDNFGISPAIYGETAVIGANSNSGKGAAYVYVRSGTTWTQQQKLTASDGASGDSFGQSVSIQGNAVVVGAWLKNTKTGMAYLYTYNGISWSQQNEFTGSDSTTLDQFGDAVDFDGNTIVIGANQQLATKPGAAYVFIASPDAPTNTGDPFNPEGGDPLQADAVNLKTGEKWAQGTDISVTTPVGALSFTRTYRQSKKTSSLYQFMGLGWIHTHAAILVKTTGTPNTILIQMGTGGELHFTESSAGSNHYVADPGSASYVDYNAGTTNYTLTMNDKSTYVFNSSGNLTSRTFPSLETWTYTYTSGKLTRVDDGYGRQLNFVYVSNPGQYNDGQLWRVGDQTTTNLSTSPTGPYVEFSYVTQKNNGVDIASPKALLSTVKDLLGNTWTYDYYGQHAGETISAELDFFTLIQSPSVDTTGDGVADGSIKVENVSYTLSGSTVTNLTMQRGIYGAGSSLLTTDFAFQPGGANTTTETTAGTTSTHSFENGVYGSFQDPLGNLSKQAMNFGYKIGVALDANGNRGQSVYTMDGKQLLRTIDGLGNQTVFNYNIGGASDGTLQFSLDPEGRKTQYTYGDTNNPLLPTRVQTYDTDGATILRWMETTYDTHGRVLTMKLFEPTGTTVEKQITNTYYTTGNGNGLLNTMAQVDLLNGSNTITTTYFYDAQGRKNKTSQSSTFGPCNVSFTVYDIAGHVSATICNYVNGGADPTTQAQAIALFDPTKPDQNKVTTYDYDTMGRGVKHTTDAGASYAIITITAYDHLNRVIRTIGNYVSSAAITDPYVHARVDFQHGADNTQNMISDSTYNERGTVKSQTDILGTVTLFGYDTSGRLVRTVQSASQPTYNNSFATGADPSLSQYYRVALTNPDVDIISKTDYDAAGNAIKSTDPIGNISLTGYDSLNRVVRTIASASRPTYDMVADRDLSSYPASSAADKDIVNVTEYDTMGRVARTQDAMGNWNIAVYDALGRSLKSITNAATPTYSRIIDPQFTNYRVSSAVDQDIITQQAYDLAERGMETIDPLNRKSWVGYDGLGRAVRQIKNALGSATDEGVKDPRSATYGAVTNIPDRDIVATTEYDTSGRAARSRDALGNWTLMGYDSLNRPVKTVRNASNPNYSYTADPTLALYQPAAGATIDQDVTTKTFYDAQGRVDHTVDPLGHVSKKYYDTLGRVIKTVSNYVTGTFNPLYPDQDITSTVTYDLGGRKTLTVASCGARTSYAYDRVNRTVKVTSNAGSTLAVVSYTCFDKAGRTLRTIANYLPSLTDRLPDAKDALGNWLFAPAVHGLANDANLIVTNTLDALGRTTQVTDPLGNTMSTAYYKNGSVESVTDPLGNVTKMRYDKLKRTVITVGSWQDNGVDPSLWVWSTANGRWENGSGTAITFGTNNDRNIITTTSYDKVGRKLSMRDSRGNQKTYAYDLLDRRVSLTDPLNHSWTTAYTTSNGTMTTNVTDPLGYITQISSNRLGSPSSVTYLSESPKNTPDLSYTYDKGGRPTKLSETGAAGALVRSLAYTYDQASRMIQADFDTDGNGTIDQTLKYAYDGTGRRTQITLPDGKTVSYTYNCAGQLTTLTDWASQLTRFSYDRVGRGVGITYPNGVQESRAYDADGRILTIRESYKNTVLGYLSYTMDGNGNKTKLYEAIPHTSTGTTTIAYNDASVEYYRGTWTAANPYETTTTTSAAMRVAFFDSSATLTMGQGPDHSIYDVYIDGDLWGSIDGYASIAGDRTLTVTAQTEGPHLVEITNHMEKNSQSTGYQLRFKTLVMTGKQYDLQTTTYTYDARARVLGATLYAGTNTNGTSFRGYTYTYDVGSNRTQQVVTISGTPTTTNYTYNAANQIATAGGVSYTYDNDGRLTSDGTTSYTWDRANRMLSAGTTTYLYDGAGRRIQQVAGGTTTTYTPDIQGGLWKMLTATAGANVTRYVHGPVGILSQQNPDATWRWI